jgi:signal transduction histidine kinase
MNAPVKPSPKKTSVVSILRDVVEAVAAERDIGVRIDADETLTVMADEKLFVSALSNLLHNALKFTRNGGTVVLRAYQEAASVVIEVEDECGGLPPGKEEELFTPFVQRGNDRQGLGLGLAIARKAIQAHDGELSVRNLPGKGCVFTLKVSAEPSTKP